MSEHSKGLVYEPQDGIIVDPAGLPVAAMHPGNERDALGRKMAAAPELVEALARLVRWETDATINGDEAWSKARAALKKAGVEP